MRTIPGMVVVSPADAVEARAAVEAAILHDGPVYLRFGRLAVPQIFDRDTYQFTLGKGICVKEGSDATIIATGLMLFEAIDAAEQLSKEGISVRVIDIHTIKPIDRDIIVKAAEETGCIVTAEEHNIYCGLGSAVAEVLVENAPVPMERVGVKDVFGRSGKPAELLKYYHMTADDIVSSVKKVMLRK